MKNNDKMIAKYIILAQISSDGGKNKYGELEEVLLKESKEAVKVFNNGYKEKERYIAKAIKAIISSKKSQFRYVTKYGKDQNGYKSLVTYFEFKLNGKRKQISFHSPIPFGFKIESNKLNILNSERKTEWNKRFDSAYNCLLLYNEFFSQRAF